MIRMKLEFKNLTVLIKKLRWSPYTYILKPMDVQQIRTTQK